MFSFFLSAVVVVVAGVGLLLLLMMLCRHSRFRFRFRFDRNRNSLRLRHQYSTCSFNNTEPPAVIVNDGMIYFAVVPAAWWLIFLCYGVLSVCEVLFRCLLSPALPSYKRKNEKRGQGK